MDNKLTEKIQSWLDTPEDNRDYDLGALYLLQLSNNQIMYRNISRNAKKHAQLIEHQINKYMKFRVATLTHEQVAEMQKKVDMIIALRHLDKEETGSKEPAKTTVPTNTEVSSLQNNPTSTNGVGFDEACGGTANSQQDNKQFKAGKRLDHDSLPVEIQTLYIENGNIIHKMRELHLQLRELSKENATCPDSERYPFLKELIALDKTYHKNWQIYDSWTPQAAITEAQSTVNSVAAPANTAASPATSEHSSASTEQSPAAEAAPTTTKAEPSNAESSPATTEAASTQTEAAPSNIGANLATTDSAPSTSESIPAQATTEQKESPATTEQSQSVATAQAAAPHSLITDERQNQKNIYRQINLTKGRYKKNPSDALKEQLAALYSQLASPTETLTLELKTLHVIE